MPFPWLLQLWVNAHLLFRPIYLNHETPQNPERHEKMELTTQEGVVKLMQSSQTESEWNHNADQVKAANGGNYPPFWFGAIVLSGLADRTARSWGGDADIHIYAYRKD